jgi:hypothetical protein
MVYDLDGDGKAEVACKTADGTTDGQGVVIGNAEADYRLAGFLHQARPEARPGKGSSCDTCDTCDTCDM